MKFTYKSTAYVRIKNAAAFAEFPMPRGNLAKSVSLHITQPTGYLSIIILVISFLSCFVFFRTQRFYSLALISCSRMAINRVIVDGEHKKMATCSNDGTAKVFDATKLDGKSATNRSKMSYNKQGGKLKSITFAQGGSAIATVSGMDLLRRETGSRVGSSITQFTIVRRLVFVTRSFLFLSRQISVPFMW